MFSSIKTEMPADTIFADVAYDTSCSVLCLRAMKRCHGNSFNQVYLQEMGSSISVHYRNNDTITRNVTRNFEIWDVYKNSLAYSFSAGATNIGPLTSVDYNAIWYILSVHNPDSALFRITALSKNR